MWGVVHGLGDGDAAVAERARGREKRMYMWTKSDKSTAERAFTITMISAYGFCKRRTRWEF